MSRDEMFARLLHCLDEMLTRPLGTITDVDYTAEYYQLREKLWGVA